MGRFMPGRWLMHCLSHGFGLGLLPRAPGTFGSLWGLVLVVVLQWLSPAWGCLVSIVPLFLAGVPICESGQRLFRRQDPGQVVFDEIAAFPIVFACTPITWPSAILGFSLFRLFDILKPWPIRRFERFPGGWGVMADDSAAGLFAGALLWLIVTGVSKLSLF